MLESVYQHKLIDTLEKRFPGIFILKNDSGYLQGVPDLLLLFERNWAMLEVKRSTKEKPEPNQQYYVGLLNSMSYAAFINPENEKEIINELAHAFQSHW